MKFHYVILFIFLQNTFCTGQIFFQSAFGDTSTDQANVVIQNSMGGYCIAGSTGINNPNSSDIAVYFINNLGELISNYSYKIGFDGNEYVTGLVESPDGGILVCGTTFASPLDPIHSDIFVLKIQDFSGTIVWSNVYGGAENDEAKSIIRTPDNNYIIAGSTMSFGNVNKSAFALKINENGIIIKTK